MLPVLSPIEPKKFTEEEFYELGAKPICRPCRILRRVIISTKDVFAVQKPFLKTNADIKKASPEAGS